MVFPIQLDERSTEVLREALELLHEKLLQHTKTSHIMSSRHMMDVLLFIINEVYMPSKALRSDETGLLLARYQIERRYRERLSIEELADVAGLSPGYFGRAFKAEFGVTPMAYQREVKVRAAKSLLIGTNLRCKEVAARTGFDDAYHLSNTFKRLTGVSPVEYRRNRYKPHPGQSMSDD